MDTASTSSSSHTNTTMTSNCTPLTPNTDVPNNLTHTPTKEPTYTSSKSTHTLTRHVDASPTPSLDTTTSPATPPYSPAMPDASSQWKVHKAQMMSPEYIIYRDKDIDLASQAGNIPKELRHRLIRSTISNMQAVAYCAPFNRRPSNAEVQEMAKSLVMTYPCLKDPQTGHVSNTKVHILWVYMYMGVVSFLLTGKT